MATSDIVVSIALGGPSFAFATLENVVIHTVNAHLIVHLSAGSDWGPGFSESRVNSWISKHCHGRVTLNRNHLRVQPGSPGVLGAHLSNFHVCEAAGWCANPESKFVLMAANVLLLRHGLEQHVASHSLSFCIHQSSCADATLRSVTQNWAWRSALDMISWEAKEPSTSSLLHQIRHSARTRNDSVVVNLYARHDSNPGLARLIAADLAFKPSCGQRVGRTLRGAASQWPPLAYMAAWATGSHAARGLFLSSAHNSRLCATGFSGKRVCCRIATPAGQPVAQLPVLWSL